MQIGAAYIRVSTEEQLEFSPDAQKRAIKDYAKKNDIILKPENIFVDEGISGRRAEKRPAFMEMIAQAKKKPKPFDIILVHKFDRFARSREDSVVFKSLLRKECGIKVVSITEQMEDDKFSIILESMLEAMAEYYSLNLADEVRKGMFEKARRGEHIGKAPYGYELENKKLIPNTYESEIVKKIFFMYTEEKESLTSITRYLNYHHITTKKGGKWRNCTINYILRNHIYTGLTRYNYISTDGYTLNAPQEWIIAQGTHTPIIEPSVFEKAQQLLNKNTTSSFQNIKAKKIYSWCQHLLYCSECGKRLILHSSNRNHYFSFSCSGCAEGLCTQKNTWSNRKMERILLSAIQKDMPSASTYHIYKTASQSDSLELLKQASKKLQEKKKLMQQAYFAKIDSLDEYRENKKNLYAEESKLKERMQLMEKEKTDETLKLIYTSFYDLLTSKNLSPEEKNKIAKHVIKAVNVNLRDKEIQIIYSAI